MIRRDICLAGREPSWLLISQIEHARISGLLAEHCIDKFGQSTGGVDLGDVREELLSAITHHDDGWASWEAKPGLDVDGRPLSFRELPLAESIPIWDASIAAAAQLGDLADVVVTMHFLALLESSEKPTAGTTTKTWQAKMNKKRVQILACWKELDPQGHRAELAAASLNFLQLFDVMSLWLCSACPGGGEHVAKWPGSYRFGAWEFAPDLSCAPPANAQRCRVTIEPWPFDVDELAIDATGSIAPVRKYRSPDELQGAMMPHEVRWLLAPAS